MTKCVLLFTLICISFYINVNAKYYTDDYCWRDYDGDVPYDALEAGRDEDGKVLYLGQVYYESKIVPGKIYDGDEKIYFEFYNVEYSSKQNAKILCTKSKDTFEWIPTQHTQVLNLLPQNTLIKGGFETNCDTYLGRLRIENTAQIGKVMCCKGAGHCYGLYITNNGTGQLHFNFDVLAYNRNSKGAEIADRINVKPVTTIKQGCKQTTINMFY